MSGLLMTEYLIDQNYITIFHLFHKYFIDDDGNKRWEIRRTETSITCLNWISII